MKGLWDEGAALDTVTASSYNCTYGAVISRGKRAKEGMNAVLDGFA